MTDIVEQLRKLTRFYDNQRGAYGQDVIALRQAADEIERLRREISRTDLALLERRGELSALREEIERLRSALRRIGEKCADQRMPADLHGFIDETVRAALEGKD